MSRRLLLVTTTAATLEAFLLAYPKHFSGLGWQTDAAASGVDGSRAVQDAFCVVYDVPWTRRPRDIVRMARGFRQMRRIVPRYELVHVHTPIASWVTRAAVASLRPGNRPRVVYTAHGFHFHSGGTMAANSIFWAMERAATRWTDALVVINEEDRLAAARLSLDPAKLYSIPGVGIDLDYYARDSVSAHAASDFLIRIAVPEHARVFSMVAEFTPNKRHVDVVKAFSEVNDDNVYLVLAGSGPTVTDVHELVTHFGLEDRVRFTGVLRDVRPLILASVATILASDREGLSRTAMESLALGTPVIGTRTRGIADVVSPVMGYLVPRRSPCDLLEAMRRALEDFPPSAKTRAAARATLEPMSLARVLRKHDLMYSNVLSHARARPRSGQPSDRLSHQEVNT